VLAIRLKDCCCYPFGVGLGLIAYVVAAMHSVSAASGACEQQLQLGLQQLIA
jgi:hypothetical protein